MIEAKVIWEIDVANLAATVAFVKPGEEKPEEFVVVQRTPVYQITDLPRP